MSDAKTSEEIQQELGPQLAGECLTGEPVLAAYSTAACIYKIRPLAVVMPRATEDVVRTVRYGYEHGVPVIPRGAATGLAGQVLGRGIVLDFTRYMNQVEEIHPGANRIRVQPGAILGRVNERLKALGKRIPQDPASEAMCSIGGTVGNNAGGLRAFRVGSTKHHVRGLEVVLSDGTVAWLRPVKPGSPELAEMEADTGTLGKVVRETRRLLCENEKLIAEKRPLMEKNTAGYDIFSVGHDGLVDLTRIVVGSEGSLAVVTDVELALMDLPKHTATAVIYFESMEKAGAAVPEVLKSDPIAVEFMEKNFLDVTRGGGAVPPEYLPERAQAALLVEFVLDSDEKNRETVRAMTARVVDELGLGFTWREAYDADEQEMLWKLRKAALPILHKLPPPKQITPFIEDSVVPPERLVEYIHELWAIFDRHGVEAAMYGHAGDANLHVRPLLDLRTQEDIDKMVAIADEAADLVLRMGGTLSGEHGDGRERSPYLRRQFGPLYDVMRELKTIWDPRGILAPENVITDETQIHTDHLRYGTGYRTVTTGTEYDRERLRMEIEKCHGCGTCLAHCPSYLAGNELWAAPRAKACVLRAVITGEIDFADASLDDELKSMADLCYNCKVCRVECPSGVDVPALVLAAKAHRAERRGLELADRLFGRPRLAGKLGSLLAPLSNAAARSRFFKRVGSRLAGIAERRLPEFRSDTLEKCPMPEGEPGGRRVALFAGCFQIFNDPAAGRALVDVLAALGCELLLPEQRCCGLPAYTSGDRATALGDMHLNVSALAPLVAAGYDVVSGCPSCVLSLREDYPELLEGDAAAAKVAGATFDATDYVARLMDERGTAIGAAPGEVARLRLAYHSPCHLRALGHGNTPRRLLERAGLRFELVNTTCCGMGGTFGMKQANLDRSRRIGEDFFRRLKEAGIDAVVTPCGMCKTQIEGETGLAVRHPLELLAAVLRKAPAPVR